MAGTGQRDGFLVGSFCDSVLGVGCVERAGAKFSRRAIAGSDGLVKHTWSKNIEQWNKTGSDRPYHYLGSAIWFTRIGHAAGEAMLELLQKQGQ